MKYFPIDHNLINRFYKSRFVKDSLWAIIGSGGGYALILAAGILVAIILGSSKFGEYGFIKSTMFQFATFATLGLHFTSTKFIAENRENNPFVLASMSRRALSITTFSSLFCATAIFISAHPLAVLLNHEEFDSSLRFMGGIVVFRAIATTQYGILAGFGDFRAIGKNNILSGLIMLTSSALGAWLWGLYGALTALALSQVFNSIINGIVIRSKVRALPNQIYKSYIKDELRFTFPVAMQDISANLGNFLIIFIIAKFSSMVQLGIYTAAQQWYVVAIFIPSLLHNVILSHLSKDNNNKSRHFQKFRNIVKATFLGTFATSLFLICAAPFITKFYGQSFDGLTPVIIALLCLASVSCLTGVYKSELISDGHIWQLFLARLFRDVICITSCIFFLICTSVISVALTVSIVSLCSEIIYLLVLFFIFKINNRLFVQ